jgi:excisionase family DNA binding protein
VTGFDLAKFVSVLQSGGLYFSQRIDVAKLAASDDGLPLLLTVDETAILLRTTRGAIYAMVARAQIPGLTRLGRRVLFHRDHLLDSLDQNRAPSSTKE